MQTSPKIIFHEMDASDAVRDKILEKIAKIEALNPNITGMNVSIEWPHRHQRKGRAYFVHIHAVVPGGEIVISRERADDEGHEDVFIAIRDAFNRFRRRLDDFTRRSREETKRQSAA